MNYEKRIKRIRKQIAMRMMRAKRNIRYGSEIRIDCQYLRFSDTSIFFATIEMTFANEKNDSHILTIKLYNSGRINGKVVDSNEFIKRYLYRNWIRAWLDDIEKFLRLWDLENLRK